MVGKINNHYTICSEALKYPPLPSVPPPVKNEQINKA